MCDETCDETCLLLRQQRWLDLLELGVVLHGEDLEVLPIVLAQRFNATLDVVEERLDTREDIDDPR